MARYGQSISTRAPLARGNMELERAKTILRRSGRVVYNATVTDGRQGVGLVKVDGVNHHVPDVIEMAKRIGFS